MRSFSSANASDFIKNFYVASPSIEVVVDPDNLDIVTIPKGRIKDDSFVIDFKTAVSDELRFGKVIAPDLTAEILNDDGLYDNIDFVGKELRVYSAYTVTGTTESVSFGRFICDSAPLDGKNIVLRGLGIIAQMDKIYQSGDISFPVTVWNLADALVTACGLSLKTYDFADGLNNRTLVIPTEPDGGKYTYRQLLGSAAEIMGGFVQTRVVSGAEKVVIRNYLPTGYSVSDAELFNISVDKDYVYVDRVNVISANGTTSHGSGDVIYEVKNNPLVDALDQAGLDAVAAGVYNAATLIEIFKFSAEIFPNPILEPLDVISYKPDGTTQKALLMISTDTWRPFRNTSLSGAGFQKKETDDFSPFTAEQNSVLDDMQASESENADAISTLEAAVSDLEDTVTELGTDYVTEIGSNADGWRWRKWKSGAVEQWGSEISVSLGSWTAYTSELQVGSGTVDYPITLSTAANSVVSAASAASGSLAYGVIAGIKKNADSAGVRIMRSSTISSVKVDIYVRGTAYSASGTSPIVGTGTADNAVLTE